MSRVRQRSPRNSVDGNDDMSTGSASPAPLLPSSVWPPTESLPVPAAHGDRSDLSGALCARHARWEDLWALRVCVALVATGQRVRFGLVKRVVRAYSRQGRWVGARLHVG